MKYFLFAAFALGLLTGCGGTTNTASQTPPPFSNDLPGAANATYVKYMQAVTAASPHPADQIPQTYWADGIKALNPVRVYKHRVNIVVVEREKDGIEEGKHISLPISSYHPANGEDGFTFTPNPKLGRGVSDYKRNRN